MLTQGGHCVRVCFICLCLMASNHAYCWLGERLSSDGEPTNSSSESDDVLGADETLEPEQAPSEFVPWIASEELQRQRLAYRKKIRDRWPNARESLRKTGFTYYAPDFKSSVSVLFSRNEIEIIVPRGEKKNRTLDPQHGREKVRDHLRQLLGMNKKAMLEILAAELLLDPNSIQSNEQKEQLIFAELFPNNSPSQEEIHRVAHRILQTARVHVKDQSADPDLFVSADRIRFVMNMPDARVEGAAKKYFSLVQKMSDDYDVPSSLVLAIMHTESFFNPLAKSSIPAFGLMQIVPHTAGADAAQLIFPQQAPELSPAFLFDEQNNLQFGAAYLHILYYRYLSGITNERSRAYTAIAAYNTGPSNIARAFVSVPRMSQAIPVINAMSEREVLERMRHYAPSAETRSYITKVIAREQFYQRAMNYW